MPQLSGERIHLANATLEPFWVRRDADIRKAGAEALHHARQHIARLRVSGGHGQRAAGFSGIVLASLTQVFCLLQRSFNNLQNPFAGIGQDNQALAVTDEDIDPQFLFQFANLAAYPWLLIKQRARHFSQIEAAAAGFADRAQLLEIHIASLLIDEKMKTARPNITDAFCILCFSVVGRIEAHTAAIEHPFIHALMEQVDATDEAGLS